MNTKALEIILNQVDEGNLSVEDAVVLINELSTTPTYVPYYPYYTYKQVDPQKFEITCTA